MATRYLSYFLLGLSISLPSSADPFLQKVEKATSSNRILLVLNHFDTCAAIARNKNYALGLLNAVEAIGQAAPDGQLIRYCRFIRDTYPKTSDLTYTQKAALFLAAGERAAQEGNAQIAAVCSHFAGQCFFLNAEYGKAFEYQLAANKGFRKIGFQHIPEISRYLYEQAFNYYYFNEYDKALELLTEATHYPAFNANLAIQTFFAFTPTHPYYE